MNLVKYSMKFTANGVIKVLFAFDPDLQQIEVHINDYSKNQNRKT